MKKTFNSLPQLVITDIDGVWTNGLIQYTESGIESKTFNVKDGWGVRFLQVNKIPIAIMTGESSLAVKRRAKKLKIDHVYLGVKDKLHLSKQLCKELDINLSDVAFIGDELNDFSLLKSVGLSACPSDASEEIRNIVDVVLKNEGGNGVFREFVVLLLKHAGVYEKTIELVI